MPDRDEPGDAARRERDRRPAEPIGDRRPRRPRRSTPSPRRAAGSRPRGPPVGDPVLIRGVGEEAPERGAEHDAEPARGSPSIDARPAIASAGPAAENASCVTRSARAARVRTASGQAVERRRARPLPTPVTTIVIAHAADEHERRVGAGEAGRRRDDRARVRRRRGGAVHEVERRAGGVDVLEPAVGGTTPVSQHARRTAPPRSAPAAPSVWPMAPLIEFTGTRRAPNTRASATASIASLYGVPGAVRGDEADVGRRARPASTSAAGSRAPRRAPRDPAPSCGRRRPRRRTPATTRPHACAAARRVRLALDHDDGRPFAEDEPASGRGRTAARRRSSHAERVEARDDEATEEIGAAREHDVGTARADPRRRERDGVRAGRARELRRGDRARARRRATRAARPARSTGRARGPRSRPAVSHASKSVMPPSVVPSATPSRSAFRSPAPRPASSSASAAARRPNAPARSGSPSSHATSAATCGTRSAAANRSIGRSAPLPSTRAFQNAETPKPTGLCTPQPVTTARRPSVTPPD